MKEIKLNQGKFTQVDDEDYEYLNQWKWYIAINKSRLYVIRKSNKNEICKGKTILMHRIILNVPSGLETDHIDHNGLNNQKSNLRICTHSQNQMNCTGRGKSKYLGVSFHLNKYWIAHIKYKNKYIHLGLFNNEKDAATAYDEAAKKYHGKFANLNFKKNG